MSNRALLTLALHGGQPARRRSGYVAWPLLALALLLPTLTACDSNAGACDAGEPCECSGGSDCFLGCDGDGCRQRCYQLNHCGGVCEDDCSLECFDVDECSQSCGNDCRMLCHNTVACGTICGANCEVDCHDVDRCGVRAGNGSRVNCHNLSVCAVECLGSCVVECEAVGRCDVTCLGGLAPTSCTNGSVVCGGC